MSKTISHFIHLERGSLLRASKGNHLFIFLGVDCEREMVKVIPVENDGLVSRLPWITSMLDFFSLVDDEEQERFVSARIQSGLTWQEYVNILEARTLKIPII